MVSGAEDFRMTVVLQVRDLDRQPTAVAAIFKFGQRFECGRPRWILLQAVRDNLGLVSDHDILPSVPIEIAERQTRCIFLKRLAAPELAQCRYGVFQVRPGRGLRAWRGGG